MVFKTTFLYFFTMSACLIYGIGIKNLLENPEKIHTVFSVYIKNIIGVSLAIIAMRLLLIFVLIPYHMTFLFPFFTLLLLVIGSMFIKEARNNAFTTQISDFTLSYFSVFLAVNEGTSFASSLIIGFATITSFYILVYVLYAINKKNLSVIVSSNFKTLSLMLITMAIILLALYGWNVSWLRVRFF